MRVMEVQGSGKQATMKEASAPIPEVGPDDVLIKVHAAGVNRPDILQKQGLYPAPPGSSPYLGLEVAGEVAAVGSAVAKGRPGLAVGRRVMALTNGGGYAQYVAVPYAQLMATPMSVSDVSAAAIMETLLTTWYNLIHLGGLQQGSAMLVHGATGGIGSMALRLSAAAGARAAIGTAGSTAKAHLGLRLGAHVCVDYSAAAFDEVLLAEGPLRDFVRGKLSHVELFGACDAGGDANQPRQLAGGVWVAPPQLAAKPVKAFAAELSAAHRSGSALWEGLGPFAGGVGADSGIPGHPPRDGLNLVLDMIGGAYIPRNLAILGTAGRHVSIAFQNGAKVPADLNLMRVMLKRLVLTGSTLRSRSPPFKGSLVQSIAAAVQRHRLLAPPTTPVHTGGPAASGGHEEGSASFSAQQWLEAAPLTPLVGGVRELAQAQDAHDCLLAGEAGKQVLRVEHAC